MSENLHDRKKQFIEYLKEEYSDKSNHWWESRKPRYQTTAESSYLSKKIGQTSSESIVKYNIKGKLIFIILSLLFSGMLFLIPATLQNKINMAFCLIVINFFVIVSFLTELKRKPKIIINKDGIQLDTLDKIISWENLVASFIKEDNDGEGSSFSLLLHYYLEQSDSFEVVEYPIGELEMIKEDLSLEIEYWKMKTGDANF